MLARYYLQGCFKKLHVRHPSPLDSGSDARVRSSIRCPASSCAIPEIASARPHIVYSAQLLSRRKCHVSDGGGGGRRKVWRGMHRFDDGVVGRRRRRVYFFFFFFENGQSNPPPTCLELGHVLVSVGTISLTSPY